MTTTRPVRPVRRSWRLARLTAPMAMAMAGRRFFPLWAVVHHRGRKTGRPLSLPVAVTPFEGGFIIVLPWGPQTNWARNVLAAGGCTVRWKGRDFPATQPELLDIVRARPYFGRRTWTIVERVFRADSFLLLRHDGPVRR